MRGGRARRLGMNKLYKARKEREREKNIHCWRTSPTLDPTLSLRVL